MKESEEYCFDRAWIEIDLENLVWNVMEIKKILPTMTKPIVVVKNNAYGHGIELIVPCLLNLGIKDFAVATYEEGIELRKLGVTGMILILGYTIPDRCGILKKYCLTQTIIDYEYACRLNQKKEYIDVHIKINTGLNRIGINADKYNEVFNVINMKYICVKGIYTHLSIPEDTSENAKKQTINQIEKYEKLVYSLHSEGYLLKSHIFSSYGILNYLEDFPRVSDFCRPGIILYGVYSTKKCVGKLNLKPVLSLKSRIESIRYVEIGESIGYTNAYIARKKMKIAVVSIGYGDGIPRNICDGEVIVNDTRQKILGSICMDQMIIDVSDKNDISPEDEVVIIGNTKSHEIKAVEVAEKANTITNEILGRLGSRLPRVLKCTREKI